MQDLLEQIEDKLQQGYHCSQIMLLLSLEMRGQENHLLLRAMGALGGGMFVGDACGTLTGGACLLSSYFPREEGHPEPTEYCQAVAELVQWFDVAYGARRCIELTGLQATQIRRLCPQMMADTFVRCIEILEEHGIDIYE